MKLQFIGDRSFHYKGERVSNETLKGGAAADMVREDPQTWAPRMEIIEKGSGSIAKDVVEIMSRKQDSAFLAMKRAEFLSGLSQDTAKDSGELESKDPAKVDE